MASGKKQQSSDGDCQQCDSIVSAAKNHIKCLERFIKSGADVNEASPITGDTPLIIAARRGRMNYARLMVKSGANVNQQNDKGKTALVMAAEKRRNKMMDLLLQSGADVNVRCNSGGTALMYAAENDNAGYTENLLTEGVTGLLLKAGADVNARCNSGCTALMYAAENGNAGVTGLLLKAGADVNLIDYDGCSAITYAVVNGLSAVTMKLLRGGAKINLGNDSITPYFNDYLTHNISVLLYAAGEELNDRMEFLDNFLEQREEFSLMNLCRQKIRNHLLHLDEELNLFIRVPQLEIPKELVEYLVYDVSLDE